MAHKIIEKVWVARLEANTNLYLGVQEIAKTKLTDQHIEVPKDCDLAVGKYFWDVSQKTFMPTPAFVYENVKKNRRI